MIINPEQVSIITIVLEKNIPYPLPLVWSCDSLLPWKYNTQRHWVAEKIRFTRTMKSKQTWVWELLTSIKNGAFNRVAPIILKVLISCCTGRYSNNACAAENWMNAYVICTFYIQSLIMVFVNAHLTNPSLPCSLYVNAILGTTKMHC